MSIIIFNQDGRIGDNCYLRDRKTGNTYSLDSIWDDYTDILIQNLRDNFTDTNFIGIRVLESRDSNRFISRYTYNEHELRNKIQKIKHKSSMTSSMSRFFRAS